MARPLSIPSAQVQTHLCEQQDQNPPNPTNMPSQSQDTTPTTSTQTRISLGDGKSRKDEEAGASVPHGTRADPTKKDGKKFGFSVEQLSRLVDSKGLREFYNVGGLAGLEKGLRTDRQCGLSCDEAHLDDFLSYDGAIHRNSTALGGEHLVSLASIAKRTSTALRRPDEGPFADRKHVFLDNTLPVKKPLSIFQLMWMAYNDFVLFFLTAAAAISLAIGLYQTFATARTPDNPPIEWVEGVAILTAIIIIVLVGSINDYQKERQFARLNKKQQDRDVKVIRSGKSQILPISDVLVGDVVHLEPGDVIPADGIFIDGYNIKCDESSITGESHLLRKNPGEEVFQTMVSREREKAQDQDANILNVDLDPFIFSGSKIVEGIGTFLVTATGVNSSHGKVLASLQEEPSLTPLQSRLTTLAKYIAWIGGIAAVLLFVALFIKFLVQLPHSSHTPAQKGQNFLNILIISLTVLVIAVPEGLPLAVTLSLSFASNKMLKDNNLVRQLQACETMGSVTSICSDKTGTLTQNKMVVVAGTVGTSNLFGDEPAERQAATTPRASREEGANRPNVVVPTGPFTASSLPDDVKEIFKQSIVVNSTAFDGEDEHGGPTFIGSQTESSLLTFARDHFGTDLLSIERSNTKIIQLIPFDAARQCMGTVVALGDIRRLYVKGASEVLLRQCTRIIQYSTERGVWHTERTPENSEFLNQTIATYASQALRTISLAYRDFEQWPPPEAQTNDTGEVLFEELFKNLVFFGVVGISDPLRDGAQEAVHACQKAGVVVRMVTGDNILTAKAIAEKCGILSAHTGSSPAASTDITMEGSEFRNLTPEQRDQVIPHLRVLARSSPEDKRILVTHLKEMGEVVAVTGDGTNDAPALAAADIGLSMGISGTEIAREASAIVLMDDNFSSIVKAIMWGRAVNDAVKKFLQFQITVSITSVLLTMVSAISSSSEQSVLTAVQLMWINLFQDTMAALALATDAPSPNILNRKPDPKHSPLINTPMWKMILAQSVYQVAVTLILYFGGASILGYRTHLELTQLQTLVFNAYVWMNIFNMYNNRRIDNKFNILEGLHRNWLFIGISLIMISGQVLIIFVGGESFTTTRLTGVQWAISIVLGILCVPFGTLVRLIPDELLDRAMWHKASATG